MLPAADCRARARVPGYCLRTSGSRRPLSLPGTARRLLGNPRWQTSGWAALSRCGDPFMREWITSL
jgi:hypothetical protein